MEKQKSEEREYQTFFRDPEPKHGGWFEGEIIKAKSRQEARDKCGKLYSTDGIFNSSSLAIKVLKKQKKDDCDSCKDRKACQKGDIRLRGCRLKRAFPDCYEKKDGLLMFDVQKISKKLGIKKKRTKAPKGVAGK